MMEDVKWWVTLLVPALNTVLLLAIARIINTGLLKLVERVEKHLDDRDRRLVALESNVSSLNTDVRTIVAMATKIDDIGREIERVRNRLDSFIDAGLRLPGNRKF